MAVRLVKDAVLRPQRCAFLPFVGSNSEPVGFFDAGSELGGDHAYLSFTFFKECAAVVNWAPLAGLEGENSRLRARLADKEAELVALREQLGAVQVLKNAGFEQARRPGRPTKGAA